MDKQKYPRCRWVLAFSVFLAGYGARAGEGAQVPVVQLHIPPVTACADPGPATLLGSELRPDGTKYLWADYTLDGSGDARVYFDYKDKTNFHYLDRKGISVTLGLCEAGVEQPFGGATLESKNSLRLARHGCQIGLFQDGKLVLAAFDDRLIGGAAGWRPLSTTLAANSTAASATQLKAEPRDDIHFADDFMISESKSEQWRGNGNPQHGDFAVKFLKNPLLSANAFAYFGSGENICSVVGEPWWDHYTYGVSMRGPVGGKIGLVLAFRDEKNYALFRWTARAAQGTEGDRTGKRQLLRCRNGQEELLLEQPGGYAPDQWYRASVSAGYESASIAMDGHVLMTLSDPCLVAGGTGVWCDVPLPATPAADPKAQPFQINSLNSLMQQHAVFDDVRVDSIEGYEDDFRVGGPLAGGWLSGSGGWTVQRGTGSNIAASGTLTVVPSLRPTKALIGDRRWAQYQAEADVRPPQGGMGGIVFLHRDEGNYYAAAVDGSSLKLIRVAAGRETVVDNARLVLPEGGVRLKASVKRGHIKAEANGVSVEAFDGETLLKGRAGLLAAAVSAGVSQPVSFSHFSVRFLPEPEPLVTTNAIFDDEMTMNDWTSPTSEWEERTDPVMVDGKPVSPKWHRGQFPGDVELMVEPRDIPEPQYEIALSVAKGGQSRNNGYVFRYKVGEVPAEGSSTERVHVQIVKQGETVAEKTLSDELFPRQLSSLAIRRCGKYVIGLVNGKTALVYRDEHPLPGGKVAFYTQGVQVRNEAVRITSDHFENETFSSAPASWRTAGFAIAEVTNRWQCDPRWSFFSLSNDQKKGNPAVLWSKNLYPGDVTVEFYVGNKMEGQRGTPYVYARDINVTICSDGSDLTKGYTCMFGGDGNRGSMIYRNGLEVKRVALGIPTDMNYHRSWFTVKVEKRGNTVTFRCTCNSPPYKIDMPYEDPQPLSGDRIALWTFDHSIMISKVRISGDGGDVSESPDFQPGALKTPYDVK